MSGYTFVQKGTAVDTSGVTTKSITLTGVTVGHLLILVAWSNRTGTPSSVTEGSDTVGTAVAWGGNSTGNEYGGVYYAIAGSATATWTVTIPVSGEIGLQVYEWSGNATSFASVFDQGSTWATANSTNPTTGTGLTPANSGELALSFLLATNAANPSWNNGYANRDDATGLNFRWHTADQVLAGTSPLVASATLATGQWAISQALFNPAPANVYAFVHDSANCSTTSVNSLATPAITVAAGDFLLAAAWSNGLSVTSVTDGVGNTYSLIGNAGSLYVYCCPNALAGSTAVTFAFSGSSDVQVYLAEYSGLGTSLGAVLAWSAATSNTGTAYSGGPVDATAVPAMIWAMALDSSNDSTAPVVAGPMTGRTTALWACNTPFDLNAVGDYQANSAGNVNSSFTVGNQFDTIKIVTVAIATAASIPQPPPLTILMNRRNQLYFA